MRLNYACELRYGVLVDLARQVLAGEPIDVSMGAVNVIWQGDANAMTLQSLDQAASPPFVINVAGPETLSVRRIAEHFGQLLGTRAAVHRQRRERRPTQQRPTRPPAVRLSAREHSASFANGSPIG